MEGFSVEFIDHRPAIPSHDAEYIDLQGSVFEIHFEIDGQKQGLQIFRAEGTENRESITQRHASPTRDDRIHGVALGFVRALVNNDLARAAPIGDLAGPFVKAGPLQARQRRAVEMAFDDGARIGGLTIAVRAGQVELAAAVYGAITVIVRFALENPLIGHIEVPPIRYPP